MTLLDGRIANLYLALHQLDAAGLDQRVQREKRSGLALTPAAVATVNKQGL